MKLKLLIEQVEIDKLLKPIPTKEYFLIVKEWLDNLSFEGRSPIGMKTEQEYLKFLKKQVDSLQFYVDRGITENSLIYNNVKAIFSKWNKSTIESINNKFSKNKKTDILKLSNATFHNKSIMSEKNFIETSKDINLFLDLLKSDFHKKVLKPELNIHFVKKELTKAGATYKSEKDIIYIRPDKVIRGEEYASFRYVILHELGHRYEKFNNLPTNFDSSSWWTTSYSKKDTMSGGEQFAELFAMSHWYNKYEKLYKEKLDKFISLMK